MKKKLLVGLVSGMIMMGMTLVSWADTIVDTGDPIESSGLTLANTSSVTQSTAAQFTLSDDYILTDILGNITAFHDGNITLSIYNDNNNTVDNTIALYQDTFSLDNQDDGWFGVEDESWALNAGTYWVAFEPGSGFDGYMKSDVPNPLDFYAVGAAGGHYYTLQSYPFGIKINGDAGQQPVPEPATMLLFGTGLAGLAGLRRRQGKK